MYAVLKPFIENPVREQFLNLRAEVLAEPDFSPMSNELEDVENLVAEEAFEAVVEKIRSALWPNFMLSPGAHVQLGFALLKMGMEREANVERALAALLLRGIEMTGDGTQESGYHVMRTSDEYDFLFAKQMEFASQTQLEHQGRHLDCLLVREHGPIYFDITDIVSRG